MSHFGNWQVALRQMGHLKKNISILMRPVDNPAVQASLQMGVESKSIQFINPEGYLGGVLEIMDALSKGAIVCIMGDRSYGFDTTQVSFLGHKAYFPYGAFSVAAAAECPVIPLLSYKISEKDYTVDISNIWYPSCVKGANKKEQLKPWVDRYVKLLEAFIEKHPYDCFLFHNVWVENKGVRNDHG